MKKIILLLFLFTMVNNYPQDQKSWIRINQLGYLTKSVKSAVFISKDFILPEMFSIKDALTGQIVFKSGKIKSFGAQWSFNSTARLDFSDFKLQGAFFIECDGIKSPSFRIDDDVYNGTADFLLNYMRQQRCGYNPYLKDSCHTHDGFIIYHPSLDSAFINVVGGWHDASDYLQYVTTSANAAYQMLFAYLKNPEAFEDKYDKDGNKGANGIPDILDEAKWGVDWLMKMNPEKDIMFNQIADDRDHRGFRLPTEDTISYGKGLERPVYFATGKPQGVFKYKNRAEGLASTAGKFSSVFSLASQLLGKYYPELSETLYQKSKDAYLTGKNSPGACQTAPCVSPYFYEEDNFVDDMELAAAQLFNVSGDKNYLSDAINFGVMEPVTPWMGADTANHYQWYPFVNLGHYWLAENNPDISKEKFLSFMKRGIDSVYQRGKDNPFQIGIPFIWCSNNLISAMLTQCRLYNEISGDEEYLGMEASLRDWLFGCNPWGTSMIVGLPANGDYPSDPHSAFTHLHNYPINGGLVDGPVYSTIYNKLIGIQLYSPDEYEQFQNNYVVYHDDYGDYSTNEPTMDGTASLTYYLSALQNIGNKSYNNFVISHGGIIKTDTTKKEVHLIFSAHEFDDGANVIMKTLKDENVKANFFFTGDFIRSHLELIKELKKDGHHVGPHSDKHLLYADWGKRDSTLISKKEFLTDLKNNYDALENAGISKNESLIFLPPYEWYNDSISVWASENGIKIINFTPGVISNADYTIPSMGKQYRSSNEIFNSIISFENEFGLNGANILIHFGTSPERTDKFYNRLGELIKKLKAKGYKFDLIKI
ncbi:MAG: glycoside hydrolase family 9 protein [Ignavibacteriales bacterium]|nr:glycoside hydrolase family 9 protein [Ignavibacteriales bacterium]